MNSKGDSSITYTLCQNGNYIDLDPGDSCTGDNHLIDNVGTGSLTFNYWALNGTTSATPAAAKIIDVTFQMSGAAGLTSTFTMRVTPRVL